MDRIQAMQKDLTAHILGLIPVQIGLAVAFFILGVDSQHGDNFLLPHDLQPIPFLAACMLIILAWLLLMLVVLPPRHHLIWSYPEGNRAQVVRDAGEKYLLRRRTTNLTVLSTAGLAFGLVAVGLVRVLT